MFSEGLTIIEEDDDEDRTLKLSLPHDPGNKAGLKLKASGEPDKHVHSSFIFDEEAEEGDGNEQAFMGPP